MTPDKLIRIPHGYSPEQVIAFRAGWAAAYDAIKDDLHAAIDATHELRAATLAAFALDDEPKGPEAPKIPLTRDRPARPTLDVGNYGEQLAAKGGVIDPEIERRIIEEGG